MRIVAVELGMTVVASITCQCQLYQRSYRSCCMPVIITSNCHHDFQYQLLAAMTVTTAIL